MYRRAKGENYIFQMKSYSRWFAQFSKKQRRLLHTLRITTPTGWGGRSIEQRTLVSWPSISETFWLKRTDVILSNNQSLFSSIKTSKKPTFYFIPFCWMTRRLFLLFFFIKNFIKKILKIIIIIQKLTMITLSFLCYIYINNQFDKKGNILFFFFLLLFLLLLL